MRSGKARPERAVAGLAETVKALRAELYSTMESGKDERLHFDVDKVTMEFAVEVTADTEAAGGVRFGVLDVSGTGRIGRAATHTVVLEMTPKSGSRSVQISDEE